MERNIGSAIIYDHNGVNKEMKIIYRRFPEEKLNELPQ